MTKDIFKVQTKTIDGETVEIILDPANFKEGSEESKLFELLQQTIDEAVFSETEELSFEELYWKGVTTLGDVPQSVEGWKQATLAEQYHFDSDEQPTVYISKARQ